MGVTYIEEKTFDKLNFQETLLENDYFGQIAPLISDQIAPLISEQTAPLFPDENRQHFKGQLG